MKTMSKTKAIFTWLAFTAASTPCLLAANGNEETVYYNVIGVAYALGMYAWARKTENGKRAVAKLCEANRVLCRVLTEE